MADSIPSGSQLRFATLYNINQVVFWDVPNYPKIDPQDDDLIHVITDDELGRIDLIAYSYYQNEELWWVIMLANNKININDFRVGEQITIPAPRYVMTEIIGAKKGRTSFYG